MHSTMHAGSMLRQRSRSWAFRYHSDGDSSLAGTALYASMHCRDTAWMQSLTCLKISWPTGSAWSEDIMEYAFRISSYRGASKAELTAARRRPSLSFCRTVDMCRSRPSRRPRRPGKPPARSAASPARSAACCRMASQKFSWSRHSRSRASMRTTPCSSSSCPRSCRILWLFLCCLAICMLPRTRPRSRSCSFLRLFLTRTPISVSSVSTACTCCIPCANSL
mmetsp:Transcript_13594/g.38533  ORF Transcript_13594/g.38533 Transcript_13594/m.38533 type:complete len:222 (-) Transcript_13594:197-862(-)